MKYYKKSDGTIWAFELDGSQDFLITADMVAITVEQADAIRNPPPTTKQLIAANVSAIQAELDRQAQAKGYDNIVSACSYAAQAVGAPFQAEGAAFLAWRSSVWVQAYSELAQIQAGTMSMPTPAQAVAAMPVLVLP